MINPSAYGLTKPRSVSACKLSYCIALVSGCPSSQIKIKMELNWDNAKAWEEKANEKKEIYDEPKWSWDCNFKLDFDGSLLRVSSRFYPPHKNAGNWWEGNVTVNFLDTELLKKEFKCDTLDELKTEVERFTKHYAGAIKARLS